MVEGIVQTERGFARSPHSRGVRRRSARGLGFVLAGFLLAALLAGSAGAVDPTFVPATGSPFAVGTNPHSIAAADLNEDGKLDLATANYGSNTVSIVLGDGLGGFSAAAPVAVGTGPLSVAAADLNGDGDIDLATANGGSDNVSILLGDGAGAFTPATGSPFAAGDQPWYVVAADLNADAKLDLALARWPQGDVVSNGEVAILLGDGTGGFAPPSFVPVGRVPYGIAVAHLNADGNPDLAVANQYSSSVSILLGNGTGGFTPGTPVTVGSGPSWVAAAHLNGDGNTDLAVSNQGSDNVAILLGDGAGGFSPAPGSPVPVAVAGYCFRPGSACGPTPLVLADLNGDAMLDLAVGNINKDNVSVLVGNGLGGFTPAAGSPATVGDGPFSLAAADLNGDGKLDLAAGNYSSNNVSVLLNTTQPPTAVALRGFAARRTGQGVELRWRTAQETDLLGFDVYRSGVKVNRTLIAARGSGAAGAVYRLLDRNARAAYAYRLQAVKLDGTRAWIGRAVARR